MLVGLSGASTLLFRFLLSTWRKPMAEPPSNATATTAAFSSPATALRRRHLAFQSPASLLLPLLHSKGCESNVTGWGVVGISIYKHYGNAAAWQNPASAASINLAPKFKHTRDRRSQLLFPFPRFPSRVPFWDQAELHIQNPTVKCNAKLG